MFIALAIILALAWVLGFTVMHCVTSFRDSFADPAGDCQRRGSSVSRTEAHVKRSAMVSKRSTAMAVAEPRQ